MNPSDDQYSQGQPQPQPDEPLMPTSQSAAQSLGQSSGDTPSAPAAPSATDYPTETYRPSETQEADLAEVSEEAPVGPVENVPLVDEPPVQWTAQEYVELQKGTGWYLIALAVVLMLIAADIFFLRSYTFSVLVVVMTVALVIYIRRPPRTIQYTLSGRQGLYIGERLYHLSDFRSFGLIKDGDNHSIMLIPSKRFAPGVSVYFPEEAGEQIVDILGQRLPMETLKLDMIDIIVRKLRL